MNWFKGGRVADGGQPAKATVQTAPLTVRAVTWTGSTKRNLLAMKLPTSRSWRRLGAARRLAAGP